MTHVNWIWNKFSATPLLVIIPKIWDVHIFKEEIESTFGNLHSWFDAFSSQSRNYEIWQPPLRNHNTAYRNLIRKPNLIPILAKRQASIWRHRCYTGLCVSVLRKKRFCYLFIQIWGKVAKWGKKENLLHAVFRNFHGKDPYPVMTTLQNFSREKNKAVKFKCLISEMQKQWVVLQARRREFFLEAETKQLIKLLF